MGYYQPWKQRIRSKYQHFLFIKRNSGQGHILVCSEASTAHFTPVTAAQTGEDPSVFLPTED